MDFNRFDNNYNGWSKDVDTEDRIEYVSPSGDATLVVREVSRGVGVDVFDESGDTQRSNGESTQSFDRAETLLKRWSKKYPLE